MDAHDDVARFRADDDGRIVAASFACPVCLCLDATAQLVLEPHDFEVACSCSGCLTTWSVAVTPAQALRLVLMPPGPQADAPLRVLPVRTTEQRWPSRRAA